MKDIIHDNLIRIRTYRQLTQKQLAKKSKVSQATIAQIETGIKSPSLKTLRKISKALNVSIGTLVDNKIELKIEST